MCCAVCAPIFKETYNLDCCVANSWDPVYLISGIITDDIMTVPLFIPTLVVEYLTF